MDFSKTSRLFELRFCRWNGVKTIWTLAKKYFTVKIMC